MCHSFIENALHRDSQLYPWLMLLDRDLAREAKEGRCLHCGGRLDCAAWKCSSAAEYVSVAECRSHWSKHG